MWGKETSLSYFFKLLFITITSYALIIPGLRGRIADSTKAYSRGGTPPRRVKVFRCLLLY